MSKYLESCNNECKIVMLLLIAVLGFLLYQCYNKPSACDKEGFFATAAQLKEFNRNQAIKAFRNPKPVQPRR